MRDPMTVAFEIKSPFKTKSSVFKNGYRKTLITIWHVDPETDGTDDSCGWFMRSRHGNKKTLEGIVGRFEFDFDRVFQSDSGVVYLSGFFAPVPSGMPHMSCLAITLNLFFLAACEHFNSDGQTNWKKARKFMVKHLFDILYFAENPGDSIRDSLTRKFARGCKEEYTPATRNERVRELAIMIYGWILRADRPWYKHPRWHFWHWKIQWHFGQLIWRWLFERCCVCGKRFAFHESRISNWAGGKMWHQHCYDQSCCVKP